MNRHVRTCWLLNWVALAMAATCTPAAARGQEQNLTAKNFTETQQQVLAALPSVPSGLNEEYALRTAPAKQVKAIYTVTVNAPQLAAKEWALYAAAPPDLPGQKIVHTTTSPESTIIEDLSPLARKLFLARAAASDESLKKQITLKVEIEAELFSRRLIASFGEGQNIAPPAPLNDGERVLALAPTAQFDYASDSVQNWLAENKLARGGEEGEVDYARRVFLAIVKGFRYNLQEGQDRTAGFVCSAKQSDCGGMAALFVAALRSQGVPARTLCGRWAISAKDGERYHGVAYAQQHVKAEFFAQGVGWAPVDLSSAVLHDRSHQKLEFFGADDGDFITLHIDGDVVFNPLRFGEQTMPYLQNVSYWARGEGSFEGTTVEEKWRVERRP